MAASLIFAGAGALAQVLGTLFSQPKEPEDDTEEILRLIEERMTRNANDQTSAARIAVGQNAMGHGVTGPAVSSLMSGVETEIRSRALAEMPAIMADLLTKRAAQREAYRQERAALPGRVLGDVAGGLATIGTMKMMQDNTKMITDKLFPATPDVDTDTVTPTGGGGLNPMSFVDKTWLRRLFGANQWGNQWSYMPINPVTGKGIF